MAYSVSEALEETYDEGFFARFVRLNEIMLQHSDKPEGNLFYLNHRRLQSLDVIRENRITPDFREKRFNFLLATQGKNYLLEIGFNAGHSALIALEANPQLSYIGIDIARHAYTRPCAAYLEKEFAGRFELLIGPSAQILPQFCKDPRVGRVDLLHCDGGHAPEIATADLSGILAMPLDPGVYRHLLVDDTAGGHIRAILQTFINCAGLVTETYLGSWRGRRNACLRIVSPGIQAAVPSANIAAAGTEQPDGPLRVTQYWDKPEPPPEVAALMESWANAPNVRYLRYDYEAAAAFIREHLGERAAAAYAACGVPAMQADFFRYCALFVDGGLYADSDIALRGDLREILVSTGRGLLIDRRGKVANDFMFFREARDPLLRRTIDEAIINIEQRRSNSVWDVTGPGILTRIYEAEPNQFAGFTLRPAREFRNALDFQWDLEYKQSDNDWRSYGRLGKSIFAG
jgi:hypothetical protein